MMEAKKKCADNENLLRFFRQNRGQANGEPGFVQQVRKQGAEAFNRLGVPHTGLEKWRHTDLCKILARPFTYIGEPELNSKGLSEIFRCEVPGFEARQISHFNGWETNYTLPLATLPNGMIYGSLRAAIGQFPQLVEDHLGRLDKSGEHHFTALNSALFTDGLFVYLPDNVEFDETLQLVNLVKSAENPLINARNLIIMGSNSRLTLVHCDDSVDEFPGLYNSVTEVFLGSGARLNHYKLQNKDDTSALVNNFYFRLQADATLMTNGITLNGGMVRNDTFVELAGEQAHADILGLYLMDRYQHIDNQVLVDHAVPNCTSNEQFKGILDDNASGVFNGHILVRRDAQKTSAYQNNKNLLISDKAVVDSMPFLEIYADDVKCSHGATVGQLDTEALFYLRQRGISFESARMLLMYAFAAEITEKISVKQLRNRMEDLIKKRLRGELAVCDQCMLHCSTPEKKVTFEIDMSKV